MSKCSGQFTLPAFKVFYMKGQVKKDIDKGIAGVQKGVRAGVKDVQKGANDVGKAIDKGVKIRE